MSKGFRDAAEELRRTCFELFSLKKKGTTTPDDVAELITKGSLLCQEIKSASRDVLLAAQGHKDRVQAAMTSADAENLQLDNLRYERSHLMREILKCKTVSTAETDKIDLLPDDQFQLEAPEALTCVDKAANPHSYFMNRLAHELQLRQSMNEELSDMSGKMKSLSDEIAEKRKFLDSVGVHLKGIEKSTVPLQKYFGQRVSKKLAKQSNSAGLPGPLYVLFTQLEALEDVSGGPDGDVTVSVQNVSHSHAGTSAEPQQAASKKRGRDGDDDGSARAKKKSGGKPSEQAAAVASLLTPASKEVVLRLVSRSATGATSHVDVVFRFLPALNVVTVEAKGHGHLLTSLLPGDKGLESPRASNYFDVEFDTLFPLDAPARPYHWAQWLAGLYVPPPPAIEESYSLTSRQRMEPSTKKIVEMVGTLRVRVLRNRLVGVDVNEQITQRIAVRHALDSQLSTLPTITVHPSCSRLFPTGNETLRCPLADFLSWKPVSLSELPVMRKLFAPPGSVPEEAVARPAPKPSPSASPEPASTADSSIFTRGLQAFEAEVAAVLLGDADASSSDAGVQVGEDGEVAGEDDAAIAGSNGSAKSSATPIADAQFYHDVRYFKAVFGSGGEFLQVLVELPPDYPMRPPRVRLSTIPTATAEVSLPLSRSCVIENLERDVNVFGPVELCKEAGTEAFLLSHMLKTIQVAYPAARVVSSSSLGMRARRGRDRAPATRFNPETRTLQHG